MILYKYISASSAIRILTGLRLKAALPIECNDPFEFTPRSRVTVTCESLVGKVKTDPEHFRPLYDQHVEQGFWSLPFQNFLEGLPNQIRKDFPEFLRLYRIALKEYDLKSLKEASEHVGILCLSERSDSIPMWSHYSDGHKGVVIGIDIGDSSFLRGTHGKVKYPKHRVSIDPQVEAGTKLWWKQLHRIMFSKSLEWEYENEHRIVFRLSDLISGKLKNNRKGYFIDIWRSTINCIILGCLISPKAESALNKELSFRKHFSHVKRFRAERHPKSFSLKIVEMK